MLYTLICNSILIDPQKNLVIHNGAILIDENGIILDVGTTDELRRKVFQLTEETKTLHLKIVDLKGKILLPGMVCAHHHFYSSFARGLVLKNYNPQNFVQILQQLWWKLDSLLSEEEIYLSSIIALIDCLRYGITTIIDHHESQGYQLGCLQQIKKAVEFVGLRACLCLGVSDRYDRSEQGLQETEEFLNSILENPSTLVTSMLGLHASFTVTNKTLQKISQLKQKYNVGVHTHCAEDIADQENCKQQYGVYVVERFHNYGLLGKNTILAHCVHITEKEMQLIAETNTNVVVNPESNMNNAVGAPDVLKMLSYGINVGLGTDAMSSHMLSQAKSLYLLLRHQNKNPNVGFTESVDILFKNNPKIVEYVFGKKFNTFVSGVPLDAVVVNYIPPTPVTSSNFYGHLLFGILYSTVEMVFVNGKVLLQEGRIINFSEKDILKEAQKVAQKFWSKF